MEAAAGGIFLGNSEIVLHNGQLELLKKEIDCKADIKKSDKAAPDSNIVDQLSIESGFSTGCETAKQ